MPTSSTALESRSNERLHAAAAADDDADVAAADTPAMCSRVADRQMTQGRSGNE